MKLSESEKAMRRAELEERITKANLKLNPEFYGVSRASAITRYLVARKYDVDGAFKVRSEHCSGRAGSHTF